MDGNRFAGSSSVASRCGFSGFTAKPTSRIKIIQVIYRVFGISSFEAKTANFLTTALFTILSIQNLKLAFSRFQGFKTSLRKNFSRQYPSVILWDERYFP
ncbi:hypothetical protein [Haloflavibacter putidus]|uniref:Uncharacterized protein n=1 Tax=Haloflavibacter putidus TaxID=2576776 RepID=A0A507ZSB5_9FLAO|nr:hypothetical protein [Haloflavibacter putidus]TQD39403.1 hypothetical protein FKR84_05765 [Haloflavibacter putidus]